MTDNFYLLFTFLSPIVNIILRAIIEKKRSFLVPFHFVLCLNLFDMKWNLCRIWCVKFLYLSNYFICYDLSIIRILRYNRGCTVQKFGVWNKKKRKLQIQQYIKVFMSNRKCSHIFKTKRNKINEKTILTHAKNDESILSNCVCPL